MQLAPDTTFINEFLETAKNAETYTNQAWIRITFKNALQLTERKPFKKSYDHGKSSLHAEEQAVKEAKEFIKNNLGSGTKILRIDVVTLKSPCASRCKEPLKELLTAAASKKSTGAEFEIYAHSLFSYEVDELSDLVLVPSLKWEETKKELVEAGWNVTQGF